MGLKTVRPRLRADFPSAVPGRRLPSSDPAAPGASRLGLLPSGPDPIHDRTAAQDLTINATYPGPALGAYQLSGGDSVPHEEDFGLRAPLAPHLARSVKE